ncbi:MAG: peptidoglycan editing factor PgeF [Pseudomonadales bacterium]|nr:peptidoglycan editing factor PgeF [Pseudomonadales bacterium]
MSGGQTCPWFVPEWPVPANVGSCITQRFPGGSLPPYDGFNLATHVGDDSVQVEKNRGFLSGQLSIPGVFWLQQTHSNRVMPWGSDNQCDASFSFEKQQACAVLTADCLPLLVCDTGGTQVAAIHAGWRGMQAGIIEKTLRQFRSPPEHLLVYLGPCIGFDHFEIGEDVYRLLLTGMEQCSGNAVSCFRSSEKKGHYFADLPSMARLRLISKGVTHIFGGELCTFSERERFYSYRRDGESTGRIASLIWLL